MTAEVIEEAVAGEQPHYLTRLLDEHPRRRRRQRCGGSCAATATRIPTGRTGQPAVEMAGTARDLGHEWIALTDHSPRLTVANGLSAERLNRQFGVVDALNDDLAPFRVLTGIEVDILDDGSLDQREDLLAELDVVVASVHSKLRMPSGPMTERMVAAVRNPNVDVLGHCTGRLLGGGRGTRPESGSTPTRCSPRAARTAVEINSRPERLDPPHPLLPLAVEPGCVFTIDTDAHAPGQLDWQQSGCARAEQAGIPASRIINTQPASKVARRGGH